MAKGGGRGLEELLSPQAGRGELGSARPSTAPALRHRSPWLWFPSLAASALPHKEQPLLGMARWLW